MELFGLISECLVSIVEILFSFPLIAVIKTYNVWLNLKQLKSNLSFLNNLTGKCFVQLVQFKCLNLFCRKE